MLSCSSCGHAENIANLDHSDGDAQYDPERASDNVDEVLGDYEEVRDVTVNRTFDEGEAVEYHCNNCGATLMTDANTTATKCTLTAGADTELSVSGRIT